MDKHLFKHENKDITLYLHPYGKDIYISDNIKNTNNFFEIELLKFIKKNYPVHKNIVDVGANIGNHAVYFTEFLKYEKIYCFEPLHENVKILAENLKNKNHEIHEIALSNKNGIAPFYNSTPHENARAAGSSLEYYGLEGAPVMLTESMPTKTLDSYILNDVTMIKLDVEGHELSILEGARHTIARCKPIIFVEDLSYIFPHIFRKHSYDSFFMELGYKKVQNNIGGNTYTDLFIPFTK